MDAPHLPRQTLIDAHGGGGFRFSAMSHRGSILCLPDGIWAWPVADPAAVREQDFARVFDRGAELDFFIFGTGTVPCVPAASLRQRFRDNGISLDAMMTGPAVRTYNVMLMEGRRVGAGLIAAP